MTSPLPQPVNAPLTRAAIFLTLTLDDGKDVDKTVRELCADVSSIKRAVGFRNLHGALSCVMGIGDAAWRRLFPDSPVPKGLHPFREIKGTHFAPSTPGDILLHLRATHVDLCFEIATALMDRLGGVTKVVDEVHGFKYFDERDLTGFVDGTENPTGPEIDESVLIGDEDPHFTNGSYVITQKYLHDLTAWNKVPVETQENIIGRKKLSDIELRDDLKPSYAHNVLTTINDPQGKQLKILRDNMPFGEIGKGEFGTYFIGYACSPDRIEQMLDNMFIGKPPGNYDRLLDFSRAATGNLFFVPTADFLDNVSP